MATAHTKKIDPATLAILADCAVLSDAIKLPPGKLERKQYEAVNKILELMGGKGNRKAQAHVFSEDPTELLDTVVLTAEITDKKKQFQAFYTPVALADRMVSKANLVFGVWYVPADRYGEAVGLLEVGLARHNASRR